MGVLACVVAVVRCCRVITLTAGVWLVSLLCCVVCCRARRCGGAAPVDVHFGDSSQRDRRAHTQTGGVEYVAPDMLNQRLEEFRSAKVCSHLSVGTFILKPPPSPLTRYYHHRQADMEALADEEDALEQLERQRRQKEL